MYLYAGTKVPVPSSPLIGVRKILENPAVCPLFYVNGVPRLFQHWKHFFLALYRAPAASLGCGYPLVFYVIKIDLWALAAFNTHRPLV
jgi:hypothetical protein